MVKNPKYKSAAGKGDLPRPMFVSEEEYELRYKLAFGLISRREFDKKMRKLKEIKNRQNNRKKV